MKIKWEVQRHTQKGGLSVSALWTWSYLIISVTIPGRGYTCLTLGRLRRGEVAPFPGSHGSYMVFWGPEL